MYTQIAYYKFFGVSLITYLGILAFVLFATTALIAIQKKKGSHLLFKWHHRLATISIIIAVIHGLLGLLGGGKIGYGQAGLVQGKESQRSSLLLSAGADTFNAHCRACHQDGSNIVNPAKSIKVPLNSPNSETELAIIKSLLDAEGINYFVKNENFGSIALESILRSRRKESHEYL